MHGCSHVGCVHGTVALLSDSSEVSKGVVLMPGVDDGGLGETLQELTDMERRPWALGMPPGRQVTISLPVEAAPPLKAIWKIAGVSPGLNTLMRLQQEPMIHGIHCLENMPPYRIHAR